MNDFDHLVLSRGRIWLEHVLGAELLPVWIAAAARSRRVDAVDEQELKMRNRKQPALANLTPTVNLGPTRLYRHVRTGLPGHFEVRSSE